MRLICVSGSSRAPRSLCLPARSLLRGPRGARRSSPTPHPAESLRDTGNAFFCPGSRNINLQQRDRVGSRDSGLLRQRSARRESRRHWNNKAATWGGRKAEAHGELAAGTCHRPRGLHKPVTFQLRNLGAWPPLAAPKWVCGSPRACVCSSAGSQRSCLVGLSDDEIK